MRHRFCPQGTMASPVPGILGGGPSGLGGGWGAEVVGRGLSAAGPGAGSRWTHRGQEEAVRSGPRRGKRGAGQSRLRGGWSGQGSGAPSPAQRGWGWKQRGASRPGRSKAHCRWSVIPSTAPREGALAWPPALLGIPSLLRMRDLLGGPKGCPKIWASSARRN